jgi:hypothetical protein
MDKEQSINIIKDAFNGKIENGHTYDGFNIDKIVETINELIVEKLFSGDFMETGTFVQRLRIQLRIHTDKFGRSHSTNQCFMQYTGIDDVLEIVAARLEEYYDNKFSVEITRTVNISDSADDSLQVELTRNKE